MIIKNKKRIAFWLIVITFSCSKGIAQTQEENLKKYWNFRDKFQKYFVRIGADQGKSINFANIDNVPSNAESGGWLNTMPMPGATSLHGYKKTGDAMNMQGDYISVLATQYKLLKDNGKDVTSTLNELYYAIAAINRVDLVAEPFFGPVAPNLNGFTIRDDVHKSLALEWNNQAFLTEDSRDKYEGIMSGYYNDANPSAQDIMNEMSQDQMIGLLQGFTFVIKYVDNVFVKPTSSDAGFYIHDEVKAITNRYMNYITQLHFWDNKEYEIKNIPASYLNFLNVGSLIFGGPIFVFPFSQELSNCDVVENWVMTNPVTNQYTGASNSNKSELRPWSYPVAKAADMITSNNYVGTRPIIHQATDNGFDGTLCIIPHNKSIPLSAVNSTFWDQLQYVNWLPGGTINFPEFCFPLVSTTPPAPPPSLPSPQVPTLCLPNLHFQNDNLDKSYNVNLSLVLAAISNSWQHYNIKRLGDDWNMEIFDLMYAVLNNTAPLHPQSFWEGLLNSAPCEGPYCKRLPDGSIGGPAGWFDTNRWNGATAPTGKAFGEFNGNDYMLLYNLYQLAYKNTGMLPKYSDNSCPCEALNMSANKINNNQTANILVNSITLPRRFPDYLDFNIELKEYLTENLTIPSNKILNIETDLVICNNKTLLIDADGKINVGSSSVGKSSIIVRKGSTLRIAGTGQLVINDNCKVIIESGAKLIYDQDAKIQLQGNEAVLEIQGDLQLGNNAIFTFTYLGANSGYVKFNYPGTPPSGQVSGNNSSINLKGINKNDKILEVEQNVLQLLVANGITSFKVERGTASYGQNINSYVSADGDVRIWGSAFYTGLMVWGQPNCVLAHSSFLGLTGYLFAGGNKLVLNNSYVGGLYTQGKGFNIYNGGANHYWALLGTMNSFANNSKFIDGSGVFIIGSPAQFDFTNCKTNNNGYFGYEMGGPGLLKIKCGQINDSQESAIRLSYAGSLSMNALDKGGYVEARRSGAATIELDEADLIDINNGYSDLRPAGYTATLSNSLSCQNFANCGYNVIEGTVIQDYGPIPSNNNKWQENNLLPLQTIGFPHGGLEKFTDVVEYGSTDKIHFTAASQSDKAPCDYWSPLCTTCNRSFLDICPGCHVINTPDFTNVKTNDAVKQAIAKMDPTIPNGHKQAVDLFYQVLKYPLPVPTEGDKYVRHIAEKQILVSLAEAIEKGQILVSETTLDPHIVKILFLEDQKINLANAEGNLLKVFYATVEKALVYYSAEHRTEALSLLDGLMPYVDAKHTDYLYHLRCSINNELRLLHNEIDKVEFVENAKNCPQLRQEVARSFTSFITEQEQEETKMEKEINVKVYPNPASSMLTIEFTSPENESAQLIIYDITGKTVFKMDLKNNTPKTEINNLLLTNGIYFYRIFTNDKIIQQDKLTISK